MGKGRVAALVLFVVAGGVLYFVSTRNAAEDPDGSAPSLQSSAEAEGSDQRPAEQGYKIVLPANRTLTFDVRFNYGKAEEHRDNDEQKVTVRDQDRPENLIDVNNFFDPSYGHWRHFDTPEHDVLAKQIPARNIERNLRLECWRKMGHPHPNKMWLRMATPFPNSPSGTPTTPGFVLNCGSGNQTTELRITFR